MKLLQPTLTPVLVLAMIMVFGQKTLDTNEIKRNSLFIEVGGNAFFYSLNYDRQVKVSDTWRLAGRVGIMYVNTFTDQNRHMMGVPIEFSYLKGTKNNFLEIGLGVTGTYDQYYSFDPRVPIRDSKVQDLAMMAVVRIGYRHQKREGGLFYKVGFTPLAGVVFDLRQNTNKHTPENFAYPWVGAAIGWTLKS
jgi:hypothetical protein